MNTIKAFLIVSVVAIAGCSTQPKTPPDSSIQAVSDACSFGDVHSYQSITRGEKVAFVCK